MSSIELDEMSNLTLGRRKHKMDEAPSTEQVIRKEAGTNGNEGDLAYYANIQLWTYVAAGWLMIFSIPLLAFPRFILFLSSTTDGEYRGALTPLEKFLSLHFSILALSVAIGLLLSAPESQAVIERPRSSSHYPYILPLTSGFLFTSFLAYNEPAQEIKTLAFFLSLGAGVAGLWGLYVLLFGRSTTKLRKTGAKKRKSLFRSWKKP